MLHLSLRVLLIVFATRYIYLSKAQHPKENLKTFITVHHQILHSVATSIRKRTTLGTANTGRQCGTILLLLLLLSGDIELNPGPVTIMPSASVPIGLHETPTAKSSITRNGTNVCITDQNFTEFFDIKRSRSDGHCLLYSIITALKQLQLNDDQLKQYRNVSYKFILSSLTQHADNNSKFYADKLQITETKFKHQIYKYVEFKDYNQDSVDILPYMLAALFATNIIILEKRKHQFISNKISPLLLLNKTHLATNLYILKTCQHYDGLLYKNSFQISPKHIEKNSAKKQAAQHRNKIQDNVGEDTPQGHHITRSPVSTPHVDNPEMKQPRLPRTVASTKMSDSGIFTSETPIQFTMSSSKKGDKKAKCCTQSCKYKGDITAKSGGDLVRCIICAVWCHCNCVGILKDDPVGAWTCPQCRNCIFNLDIIHREIFKVTDYCENILEEIKTTRKIATTQNYQSEKLLDLLSQKDNEIANLKCSLSDIQCRLDKQENANLTLKTLLNDSVLNKNMVSQESADFDHVNHTCTKMSGGLYANGNRSDAAAVSTPISNYPRIYHSPHENNRYISGAVLLGEKCEGKPLKVNTRISMSTKHDSKHADRGCNVASNDKMIKIGTKKSNLGESYSLQVVDTAHVTDHCRNRISCVFVSRLSPNTPKEDVAAFLAAQLDGPLHVDKLNTRHDSYASFRVYSALVPTDELLDQSLWPDGCLVMKSYVPRNSRAEILKILQSAPKVVAGPDGKISAE